MGFSIVAANAVRRVSLGQLTLSCSIAGPFVIFENYWEQE
jgi:hypothetical protein